MTQQTCITLLDEIEAFLSASGMGETYFGRQAAGNTEVVKRLRSGRDVTTTTAERLRAYMAANPPASKREAAK